MSAGETWQIAPDVVWRESGGEIVVLDLASVHYQTVDGIGVEIWRLLADGISERSIAERLLPGY